MLKLRDIRIGKGLSVPALSRLSGIPIRTIEDAEKRGDCRLSTAAALARALNVNLDEMYEINANEKAED